MKALKKLIAVVSSLAMVAAMSVAVVNAEDVPPTLSTNLVDNNNGTYNVEVNLDTTGCEKGQSIGLMSLEFNLLDYFTEDSVNALLEYNSSSYTYTNSEFLWYGMAIPPFTQYNLTPTQANFKVGGGTLNYYTDVTSGVWVNPNSITGSIFYGKAGTIMTFKNLVLKDGFTADKIKVDLKVAIMLVGTDINTATTYSQNPVAGDGSTQLTSKPYIGENYGKDTPSEPETPAVTVKAPAVPIGDVFTGDKLLDGTDSAVAAKVEIASTADETSAITWKITVTPAEGKTCAEPNKTFTKTIPTVDAGANLTVGLIVTYDSSEIAGVTINGIDY